MSVYIIAEVGINHNGDVEIAKKLIDAAVETGCDAVKFQKRTIETVYSEDVLNSARESPWGTTQREQKEGLEFSKEEYDEIDIYCKQKGIDWLASAWDIDSQLFLRQYNHKFNKVASAMLTNIPLIEKIAEEKKMTFISTGMSTFDDIDNAVDIFKNNNCPFTLLHCVSTYPSADDEINLSIMNILNDKYGCPVGYSGHEADILPSIIAAALGASVIERHITLDKSMYGSDQAASIIKEELREMNQSIRRIPAIMGSTDKKVSEREAGVAKKLRYFEDN
ncbi:N-acetylneuraminate synthase family protein [Methanoplanus limicola]|uniref:N-acetylneuraminate synthase n=1 Tax=Methanoplanus limicola DSM 2279 TaxID=937775 RepID=H1YXB6_9EURY|nr:N-acetylneuraminate synthase family protein [Methanoplanus limicola]EHQ36853.1 N-acetylneuraminate synthase [Methanoplanus limicola DSM 2279]